MKQYISTHIFNPRLFLEGLKRLKVFTLAVSILSVTLSVLIPAITWMNTIENIRRYSFNDVYKTPNQVSYSMLIIPIYVVVFLAPFMILCLFSYLHKRREADFFHAVPYSRTCVYVSFTMSALASVCGIMLLSAVSAGVVWTLNPYTYFLFADMAVQVLVCMLAAALLCAIMAVCVMLTGTKGTTISLFALFCVLWRYILYLFQESINYYVICKESILYLNWDWFLPFRLFTGTFDSYQTYGDRFPLSQIIYSLVLTFALFALAGILYKNRKSEMAGNAAPNRIMQHIFRCLFALPVVMLMPFFMIADDSSDFVTNFIVVVASLLVYYLYELITTKSFRGFLKATPWLGGLVVAVLLFCGAHSVLKQVILYENIDADEIEWVQISEGGHVFDRYQLNLIGDDMQNTCDDEAVISFVADALHESQIAGRTGDFSDYTVYESSAMKVDDIHIVTTRIKLKSGRLITRNIIYHDIPLRKILPAYADDVSNVDITALPSQNELYHIVVFLFISSGKADTFYNLDNKILYHEFLTIFTQEYEALTDAEKMVVRDTNLYDRNFTISTQASIHKAEFRYYVTSNTPITHQVSQTVDVFITKEHFPQTYHWISTRASLSLTPNYQPTEEVTEK